MLMLSLGNRVNIGGGVVLGPMVSLTLGGVSGGFTARGSDL